MAFSYNPNSVYLTSAIPEIDISSSYPSVVISLIDSEREIFRTTLYTHNNITYARDIRAVIEQDLESRGQIANYYRLKVLEGSSERTVAAFTAIHCTSTYNGSGEALLKNHFLTTGSAKQIGRYSDDLFFYASSSESVSPTAFIVFRAPNGRVGSYKTSEHPEAPGVQCSQHTSLPHGAIYKIVVNPEFYKLVGTPLGITTYVGTRSFTHFYIESPTAFSAFYRNPFNILELCQFAGTVTHKVEVNRSEAVIHRTMAFYDQTVTDEHEAESAPLPFLMADRIAEIAYSPEVRIIDRDYTSRAELPLVLISESSVQPCDKDAALSSVKLTYRYADDSPHMDAYVPPSQPCSNAYSLPFT